MVSFSNTDAKNNGFPQSSPDALHLWKRFKKVHKEEAQNLNKDEGKKKLLNNQRQTNTSDHFNSSSSSSLGISKRTVAQEKLFRLQCQSQYKKTVQDSSFSTGSSADSDRKRRYLTSDDGSSDANQDPCVNMTGILHLKKPLSANLDNNKKYYEDRGRMPPIDWKNLTSNSVGLDQKPEKIKKAETPKETIKTIAKSKPQISDEFSNFVENSVSHKTAYSKQGNIERNINAIDSPIFKIQQRISRKTLDTIRIPASVKLSFFKTSSDSYLLNRIDTFRAIDPMTVGNFKSVVIERQDENYNCKHDGNFKHNDAKQYERQLKKIKNHAVDSAVDQVESKHQDLKVKSDKQTSDHRPTHLCDDYDRITYVDTLTDEENAAKRESRKKEMAYEDDLFTFVQNPLESSSSTFKINSSLSAPSAKKKNPYRFPFDRIKAVCREKEKVNKTLDSDDTFNVSSDLENLSVRTVSMRANYEALVRKMKKITSSCNNHASENWSLLRDDSRVLENKNKLLNRCIRASHDYLNVPENNVVEITEVKVGLRSEPLIKPISTRYFTKASTDTEKLNGVNINKNASIESLQKENEKKDNVEFQINGNVVINNSFSSTCFSEKEFHQKDKHIDSGFCIKSTDNSLLIHDSSETRLESETDDTENCNTNEFDSESKVMKIKVMSPDSENLEMDCKDVIDYDAFDVENIELFFPASTFGNLKNTVSNRMISGISTDNNDPNNSKSLESDFEISNNDYSSASASISSNLNSGSENPPSLNPQSYFNKNIFQNVNIEFSALKTDGLDYGKNQTQEIEFNNPASSLENPNANLAPYPITEISNTSKQSCNQKNIGKKDQQNCINNNNNNNNTNTNNSNVASLHNVEKSKPSNENVAVAPKPISKKMQKYRSTLENYKNKCKLKADINVEDKNVEQLGITSQIKTLHQKPLQRQILQEIQKRMHHLTFKPSV